MATGEKCLCNKCKKTLSVIKFYKHKDGRYDELCKDCLCMHVNNFEPDTYIWLMKRFDIPYIPEEWNKLRDKDYAKDPNKIGGPATFGKYLSKFKLKQWIDPETGEPYTYADTDRLNEEIQKKKQYILQAQKEEAGKNEEELKAKLEAGEISEAEYRTLVSTETQLVEDMAAVGSPIPGPGAPPPIPGAVPMADPLFEEPLDIDLPDVTQDLTDEDKIYLVLKWGRNYKLTELVELEKKYNEMIESFDVQDADTKNTLILMCKTDLKMNQAIDIGDVDGYQKLSRVSDQLRKSGKFTAAQNKEKDNGQVDCVGMLVAFCEKEGGFIPKFYNGKPNDIVDKVIQDQQNFLYRLVTNDMGFGQQLETYIKKIELEKEMLDNDNLDNIQELSDEEIVARKVQELEEREQDSQVDEHTMAFKIHREETHIR